MKPHSLGQTASTSRSSCPLCKVSLPVLGSCTSRPVKRKAPSLSSTSGGVPEKHVEQHKQLLRIQIPSAFPPHWILLSYSCCSYREAMRIAFTYVPPLMSLQRSLHSLCCTACFSWQHCSPVAATSCLSNPIGDHTAVGTGCCLHSPECHPSHTVSWPGGHRSEA